MEPLVSVIVPVYKVEDYLDRCVESIVRQTYKNLEIILVDDGSPDYCPAMCDAWAEKDSRINVIHKENGGVSSARNIAIEKAQGDWIWFVDSDDTVSADALQKLSDLIQPDTDLIVFNKLVNETYKKDERFFDEYYFKYRFGFESWNKLYKSSIIHNNDLHFDIRETIGEDLLFNIQYYQFADNYVFSDLQLYNYRIRDNSAMGAKDPNRLQKQLRVYSKIYECYQDKLDQKTLAQLFIMHLISGINQSDKVEFNCKENYVLIRNQFKKYAFSKKVFKLATNSFLNCEMASVVGRLKVKTLLFYLLFLP